MSGFSALEFSFVNSLYCTLFFLAWLLLKGLSVIKPVQQAMVAREVLVASTVASLSSATMLWLLKTHHVGSVIGNVQPLVTLATVVISWRRGQPLSSEQMLGVVFVVVGMVLMNKHESPRLPK
jgi:drug/metabolite transporter (DMT)-like permease